MPKKRLPAVEYAGQTLDELLACKDTHSLYSILFAMEQGIQLRQKQDANKPPSVAESVLLAVLSLEREVNNGGFAQFFANSSRQYAAEIVSALEQIDYPAAAGLASQAIGCLGVHPLTAPAVLEAMLLEDRARDARLEELDQEFYRLSGASAQLLAFVESNRSQFRIEKPSVAAPEQKRGATPAGRISLALQFAPHADFSLASVRELAVKLASEKDVSASDAELEGAVCLHLFDHAIKAGDLDGCESLAARAFDLAWEDTSHCVSHKQWVEKLLEAGRDERADAAVLQYLEHLNTDDKSTRFIRKRVGFFADLVRKHPERFPLSSQFLRANFQESEIEPPLVVYKGLRESIKTIHGERRAEKPPRVN